MKLIVGLGNIGREYENTRHNIGFMVVDELARRLGVSFGKEDRSAYMAEYRAPEKIIIIKPTTYMNLSGVAVGAYANFYHIDPDDIAVIQDDMDMPVGQLRIRRKGSAGGHNGIKSIIACLGSQDFPRIKIGVGAKPHPDYDLADWVLSRFSAQEQTLLEPAIRRFLEAGQALEAEVEGNTVKIRRESDEGYDWYAAEMPALITVNKTAYDLRYPSLKGKMAARKAVIETLTSAEVIVPEEKRGLKGSPTNIFKSFTPPQKGAGMMLEGADKATCEKLAGILAAKHII